MEGFKKFLFQGNLVQLAVAVVIGAVFSNLITAFTEGFITPLLGIFGGVPEFGNLYFEINGSQFAYGQFVDAVISFLLTAAILYFFVVLPMGKLLEKMVKAEESTTRECPHCYSDISKKAARCANCTSAVVPETPPEPAEAPAADASSGEKSAEAQTETSDGTPTVSAPSR